METQPCPVDCVVSDWGDWSTCSAQCSVTISGQTRNPSQYRSRSITVESLNGGALCPSELQQTQFCNQVDCATYCNKYSTCPAIASQIINVCLETQGNF